MNLRFIFGFLAGVTANGAAALRPDLVGSKVGTRNDFASFSSNLGLSPDKLNALRHKYQQEPCHLRSVGGACLAAQASLGEGQVDIQPHGDPVVNETWTETCWAEPHCVVLPRNAADVSETLKIIHYFQVKFAVRSGGHSPNPGFSSIDNSGILVDLKKLNTVNLSSDASYASVGPGARWSEVYAALDAKNVVVAGARFPTVGVGGSLLGGGFYYFTNQVGLAADNAKNFEVVLPDGSIVNANATANADLFWALKGGGPNFGIVTRYDLYTLPQRVIWVQINVYAPPQAPAVLAAFDEWQNNGASDTQSNAGLSISLDFIAVLFTYSEPQAQMPAAFAPFNAIPPIQVALPSTNITVSALTTALGTTVSNAPARHDYRGCSTRVDTNLTQEVYSFWLEKATAARKATGANQTFVLQHVGPNVAQQGINKGGNPLNIPRENHQWWTTIADWDRAEDDELVRSVSIETTKQWEQLGAERGSSLSFTFMNDASRDQDPLGSYGPENLKKLQQIAKKYDPDQIFQTLQNNGFLLSKA